MSKLIEGRLTNCKAPFAFKMPTKLGEEKLGAIFVNKSKTRKQLEKQLAIGMALINGANTFAPMALLYARPDQVLGRQQALPDWQQPVAALPAALPLGITVTTGPRCGIGWS